MLEFDLVILVPTYHEASGLSKLLGLKPRTMPADELTLQAFLFPENRLQNDLNFCVIQVGMGGEYPRLVIREVKKICKFSHILLTGTAGGLNPQLQTGKAILCDKLLNAEGLLVHQFDLVADFKTNHEWEVGTFVCVNQVIHLPAKKLELYQKTEANCVEMESQGVLSILQELKLQTKFYQMRVILDDAKTSIPLDIGELINLKGDMIWANFCKLLLIKPWIIFDLWALKRLSDKSMNSLATAILKFVQMLKKVESGSKL